MRTDYFPHTTIMGYKPETDQSDNEKVALKREKRKSHLKSHPSLDNTFVSQLMIPSESQLSDVSRRHSV